MRRPNFYSGVGLDRADHLRADQAWIEARLGDPNTRVVPVWRSRSFVAEREDLIAVTVNGRGGAELLAAAGVSVFLGLEGGQAFVAADLSDLDDPHTHPVLAGCGRFEDLRVVGPVLERAEGALLAYARGLIHWHRRHRFCGVCGAPAESAQGGHVRKCSDPACAASHFPRTDPAVIMLVHDGAERCVMGRQKAWPPGRFSTLAGFVEPGESLEEAVAREVWEEVGIRVAEVDYHSSQPWPFPSSIMLGFHARAELAPLRVNEQEIEAARWFTRAELRASPEDERLHLPRTDSIARRLIEDWIAEG